MGYRGRPALEIFEERYRRKSTLITAQLAVAQWHDMIGEPTVSPSKATACEGKSCAPLDQRRKQRNEYQRTSTTRQPKASAATLSAI
jgi:hypothetical protein